MECAFVHRENLNTTDERWKENNKKLIWLTSRQRVRANSAILSSFLLSFFPLSRSPALDNIYWHRRAKQVLDPSSADVEKEKEGELSCEIVAISNKKNIERISTSFSTVVLCLHLPESHNFARRKHLLSCDEDETTDRPCVLLFSVQKKSIYANQILGTHTFCERFEFE